MTENTVQTTMETVGGGTTITLAPLTNVPSSTSTSPNTDYTVTERNTEKSDISTSSTIPMTTGPTTTETVPSNNNTMMDKLTSVYGNQTTNTGVGIVSTLPSIDTTSKVSNSTLPSIDETTNSTEKQTTPSAMTMTISTKQSSSVTTLKMSDNDGGEGEEVEIDDKIDDDGFSTARPATTQSKSQLEDLGKLQIETIDVVTLSSLKSIFSG